MTRDDILRMAREAKLPYEYDTGRILYLTELERFARLVAVQVEAPWQNRYLKLMDLMQIREGQPNKPCCLAEREAVLDTIDELMGMERERHPMFSEGYDHALLHLKEFVSARGQE